jgi:hypothetical protein
MKDVKNWSRVQRRSLRQQEVLCRSSRINDYNWGVPELDLVNIAVFFSPLSVFFCCWEVMYL